MSELPASDAGRWELVNKGGEKSRKCISYEGFSHSVNCRQNRSKRVNFLLDIASMALLDAASICFFDVSSRSVKCFFHYRWEISNVVAFVLVVAAVLQVSSRF